MKKAMKLVWMVLAALPMIALTACGDDEPDNGISFKDYSILLNEDRDDIVNRLAAIGFVYNPVLNQFK